MITLANDSLRLSIAPELGAGIADFSIKGPTGFFFPLMHRSATGETNASLLGSFFMAPWVNRIRGERFVFRGKEHQLRPTTADGLAQHGDVPAGIAPCSNKPPTAPRRVRQPERHGLELALGLRLPRDLRTHQGHDVDRTLGHQHRQFALPAGCGRRPYSARRLWHDEDVIELRQTSAGSTRSPAAALRPGSE